jgi:LPPG:FO 2-phospho-L-lactate transferase
VVGVSPVVGGGVVKGPTEEFMRAEGLDLTAAGVARYYGPVLDGIVTDEDATGLAIPACSTDTLMSDPETRASIARVTLDFALGLA